MGLPQPLLSATRKQVEQRKLDFSSATEWDMYSRQVKPTADDRKAQTASRNMTT